MIYFSLFNQGRFDELIKETLPHVQTYSLAREAFLRVFTMTNSLFLISDETFELLKQAAEGKNPYAIYALARWHSIKRPNPDSIEQSLTLFEQAWKAGVADAGVGISLAWSFGDYGDVDHDKANNYLRQAFSQGSLLAKWRTLKQLLNGLDGIQKDPQKVKALATEYIQEDKENGVPKNGLWFYYRALAIEETEDRTNALEDLKQACELGIISAWFMRAHITGFGNTYYQMLHKKEYDELILEGANHNDRDCIYAAAVELIDNLDKIVQNDEEKRKQICNHIMALLNRAATYGGTLAMLKLGDIFRYGLINQDKDLKAACACYSMAAIQDDPEAFERLLDMNDAGEITLPEEYAAIYALKGARLGSEKLVEKMLLAYRKGLLKSNAEEIKKYYLNGQDMDFTDYSKEPEMPQQPELECTGEALDRYAKICDEDLDKIKHLVSESDHPEQITALARELLVYVRHFAQFEHLESKAINIVCWMESFIKNHPRLLLQFLEIKLELLREIELRDSQMFKTADDLSDKMDIMRANIKAADEKRWGDIVQLDSYFKRDPIEWSVEYENAIDDAVNEAYANLAGTPRNMGFCYLYWPELRKALLRRGIEWRSPSEMNPGAHFD